MCCVDLNAAQPSTGEEFRRIEGATPTLPEFHISLAAREALHTEPKARKEVARIAVQRRLRVVTLCDVLPRRPPRGEKGVVDGLLGGVAGKLQGQAVP